jgi:hypothetical protein
MVAYKYIWVFVFGRTHFERELYTQLFIQRNTPDVYQQQIDKPAECTRHAGLDNVFSR